MTVAALIEQYNTERPNNIEDALKVRWLRDCEQMIINEITNSHDHNPLDQQSFQLSVSGSTLYVTESGTTQDHMDSFDLDTTLMVPSPYDMVYFHFLDQRIAYNQNDTKRYNAASTHYNNALLVYQQFYNRSYKTKKSPKLVFDHRNI